MQKKINRCPSCGGRCLVEEYCWSGDRWWNTYSYAVNCKKCGVRGPEIKDSVFDCNKNKCKQEAIDKWNEMTATCPKSLAKPPVSYVDSTLAKALRSIATGMPQMEVPIASIRLKLFDFQSSCDFTLIGRMGIFRFVFFTNISAKVNVKK